MSKELKTGIVAVIIIALFIWGYNFLKGENLFTPGERYFFVEFDHIDGLNEASIVTISGFKVGKVVKINFNDTPGKRGTLIVKLSVANDFRFSTESTVRLYSAGLTGGQNLAIIPEYQGADAKSGDFLKGNIEPGFVGALSDKLAPKLEHTMIEIDSLVTGFNQVLDYKSRKSLNRSILSLENTILDVRKTLAGVNTMLYSNKETIEATFKNAKKITDDFSKVSEKLAGTNLGNTIKKAEATLSSLNAVLEEMKNGKGTLGKLMTDDAMYTNLTNASKELEELLREMKLNPKRFVHFSLFGKKNKPYDGKMNNDNQSHQ